MSKLLYQGAEAILTLENGKVIKNRIVKGYRIKQLDEKLRKLRTRGEARILEKLQGKIAVPKVLSVDENKKQIILEYIKGKKLSDYLDNLKNKNQVAELIGKETAKMHDLNIIHGDLTTSNMILVGNVKDNQSKNKTNAPPTNPIKSDDNLINNNQEISRSERAGGAHEEAILASEPEASFKVFFLDFGLSYHSTRIEDKAVDLHLLKQALEARHFKHYRELFSRFLEGYKSSKDYDKVIKQLEKVEMRGRYRKKAG